MTAETTTRPSLESDQKRCTCELVLTGPTEGAASLGDTGFTFATPETTDIGVIARMCVHLVNPSDHSFWDRGNHAEMVVCAGGGNAAVYGRPGVGG